ncbi:hypothetical protein N0V90_004374 [Kalmusia sp. IMI 367209]|nr:hypothetical protein N0V90_004374 [Kalmusia sp. IMI 367209]
MVNLLSTGLWLSAPSTSILETLSVDEKYTLKAALKSKLKNIPAGVLPTELTIAEIAEHHRRAVNLPHIPPDLRLDFLFKNRATIDEHGCLAIKDAEKQHIDITRAIFFYRLDEAHQFQRYHDAHRWNVAIFIALLALPDDRRGTYDESMPLAPSARNFMIAYLATILEHYNDPGNFEKREAFVKLWKEGEYDFFTFITSHKSILKSDMKRLGKAWEVELDAVRREIGKKRYDAEVAKFVGVLLPGHNSRSPAQVIAELQEKDPVDADDMEKGALLQALQAPAGVPKDIARRDVKQGSLNVVDRSRALRSLKKAMPREMLKTLMKLFPEEVPTQETAPAATKPHEASPVANQTQTLLSMNLPIPFEIRMGLIPTSNTATQTATPTASTTEPTLTSGNLHQPTAAQHATAQAPTPHKTDEHPATRKRSGDDVEFIDGPDAKRPHVVDFLLPPTPAELLVPQTVWQFSPR